MSRWLLLLVAMLAVPAAAQSTIALHCARGVPDYPDVDMRLSERGKHVVNVVFVGFRPSRGRAEWSLRDCLNTAAKLDGSRDIAIYLWYRERRQRRQEPLEPFGASRHLVYKASSKRQVLEHQGELYSLGSASLGSSASAVGTR